MVAGSPRPVGGGLATQAEGAGLGATARWWLSCGREVVGEVAGSRQPLMAWLAPIGRAAGEGGSGLRRCSRKAAPGEHK